MDPLSVTLAIISLATAVKDMAELGQKIHESFAKVSSNYQKARNVAEDIKEMVDEIKVFYEDHKDALDNMKEVRLALLDLLAKFRAFEASILPLLPQTGGRKRDRLTRAWDAWRNNNKVEECILDLQGDVLKVMRRYMWKSAMRTEVRHESHHQETITSFAAMHNNVIQGLQVLAVVERNVSAIAAVTGMPHRPYESPGTLTTDELTDRNITMFAMSTPSTSAPMLRSPDMITEEVATTCYINVQIKSIAMIVKKMTTLRVAVSPARHLAIDSISTFQLVPAVKEASMGVMHLRHHTVRQLTYIRDLLETEHIHIISVRDGACALDQLSTALQRLGMDHESLLVGTWAITLCRLVFDASSGGQHQDCRAAYLALYLLNQSRKYSTAIQNFQEIEEAYTIAQNLRNRYGEAVHIQILYCDILLRHAQLVDNKQSIKMSVEAIQILEDILDVQTFTESTSHETIRRVVQHSSSFLDDLFFLEPLLVLRKYALALQRLGHYLCIDGHPETSVDLAHLALALYRKIVSIHGDEYRADLAFALSSLLQSRSADLLPAEELAVMAEECAQLLRELAEKNPVYYARQLVNVLWKKATALERLKRDTEAITTWEEIASLAGQIIQDSALCARALGRLSGQFRRLKRHNDAARTGKLAITTYYEDTQTQAWRYYCLCRDLRQLHQFKESAEAARTSLMLYQHLASRDPKTWMGDVAAGLSELVHSLAALGDNSEALIVWKEFMSMLANLLDTHTDASLDVFDTYRRALITTLNISLILGDDEECLEVCSTTIQYLCQLLEFYPQNKDITDCLFWTKFCYAYNMRRFGRLQNAQHYIDKWLDTQSSKSEVISECDMAWWKATMTTLQAGTLDAQGHTKQALLVVQRVHNIVRPFVNTYAPCFREMIEFMVQMAQLQVNLGNNEEALQVAEGMLRLYQDSELKPIVASLAWSLYGVALTALSCRNYKRAVEAAREGCDIAARSDWQTQGWEPHMLIRPSMLAFLSYAEANLGNCSTALEYAHSAVNASLEIGDMKAYMSATAAEQSLMETRGYLADILLATGDLAQARQICEERSAYFSKRVETRMGEYRDLAPILRMFGILSCSEGRHEEGEAAAKELCRIMKMLGSVFPSLQQEVKIRLRHQTKVPILKVLDNMSERLDCGHQTGIVSLFAI